MRKLRISTEIASPPLGARNDRGFTLVELLITALISIIVLFAMWVPFVAENSFWNRGTSQVNAQRDAQLVLNRIARSARESTSFTPSTPAAGHNRLVLNQPCGPVTFDGGPGFNGGQLQITDGCAVPPLIFTLIDNVRSRVTNFTPTPVGASNKLVNIQLSVLHTNRNNTYRNTETLQTELHLRNA